jgi:hypothetical protein
VRELKGFQRITLAPGEKRTVRFSIGKGKMGAGGGDSTATLHATFKVDP